MDPLTSFNLQPTHPFTLRLKRYIFNVILFLPPRFKNLRKIVHHKIPSPIQLSTAKYGLETWYTYYLTKRRCPGRRGTPYYT